jgi:hypothetical protein
MNFMRLMQLRVLTVAGVFAAALSRSLAVQAERTNTNACLGTAALPANAGADNTARTCLITHT